jgi:hypothetical protein
MLSHTLDFGRFPAALDLLADEANAQRLANVAAETYVDDMRDWIRSGQSFVTRTGKLWQSIGWLPASAGEAEIFANAAYAAYVEDGTEPHTILPKPRRFALKIPVLGGGGYILRKKVNHPGSRAYPYFFAEYDHRILHMQDECVLELEEMISRA